MELHDQTTTVNLLILFFRGALVEIIAVQLGLRQPLVRGDGRSRSDGRGDEAEASVDQECTRLGGHPARRAPGAGD